LKPTRLVVVMARWPAPRRCKSRLAAGGLGPARAARVQQRLLGHVLAVLAQGTAAVGARGRLALAGAGPAAAARLLPSGQPLEAVTQGPGGLGERMARQFMAGLRQGYRQVVLVGSDLPLLTAPDLQLAFDALGDAPCVLGPAADGGYWLVGLNRGANALFAGIDWGGDRVLQQTLARADLLGLAPVLLPQQNDLDTIGDLQAWR
jgi:rSAM/selenodomain-associated transferase 1